MNKSPLPPGPNPDVRRVLVVISDGDDNSSNRSRGAAVEMAQRAGVIIYAISTSTQWINEDEQTDPSKRINRKFQKGEGDHVLEQLAVETGGRAFFPYRVDDLGQSFLDIGDELRHQYALAYSPAGRTAGRQISHDSHSGGSQGRDRSSPQGILFRPCAGALPPPAARRRPAFNSLGA